MALPCRPSEGWCASTLMQFLLVLGMAAGCASGQTIWFVDASASPGGTPATFAKGCVPTDSCTRGFARFTKSLRKTLGFRAFALIHERGAWHALRNPLGKHKAFARLR